MADLSKLSVLVVDDNHDTRAILRRISITKSVPQIEEAEDGSSGLQLLSEKQYDLVLTGLEMSPMNGLEFVRKVRATRNAPTAALVPIIMITAHTERHSVEGARDAGATSFLIKPISPRSLHDRITEVLDNPRAFVEAENFHGPDRRRKARPDWEDPFRRGTDRFKSTKCCCQT